MKSENFEEILNSCFDRILKGGTVEECLREYPGQAGELEPLLKTFLAAKIAAQVNPRAEFKAQAKYQFQVALAEMSEKKRQAVSRGWHWHWRSAWSIALMAILIVVAAGGSTVAAASGSMPDSALYRVKLAAEQVQLTLTPAGLGKAELNAKLADRRVAEIGYMADKGDSREVQILAQRLNNNMQNIALLAGGDGAGQERAAGGTSAASGNTSAKSSGSLENSPAIGAVTPALSPAPSAAWPPQAPVTTAVPNTTAPPMTTSVPTMTATTTTAAPTVTVPAVTTPAPTAVTTTVTAAPPGVVSLPPSLTMQAAPASDASSATFGSDQSGQNLPPSTGIATQETEQMKIARLLLTNAGNNIKKLTETLNQASQDVRPALRQAIAQAQVEYDKALKILQELENQTP